MMEYLKDVSITLLQTLMNACGAELEDQSLAVDIIEETLKKEVYNLKNYVIIDELPEEQRAPFNSWLIGQTRPTILDKEGNYYNSAFRGDYDRWLSGWLRGLNSEVID